MKTKYLLSVLCVLFLLGGVSSGWVNPGDSPKNVVLIVINDIGPGDLSCYGNRFSETPNINLLFKQSQRAENYHSYPTGGPTWASMLTGRAAEKTGVRRDYGGLQSPRKEDLLVSESLKQAGYKTAFFGRWAFGDCYPYRAIDRGFSSTLVTGAGGIGMPGDAWGNSAVNPTLTFNGKPVRVKGSLCDILFDTAVKFIDKNKNNKFFVVIAPQEAGAPYQPDPKVWEHFRQKGIPEKQAAFYAQVYMIDRGVGMIMTALKKNALDDNTVVMFTSTSGGIGGNIAGKYVGLKGDIREGGHRTVFWMRNKLLFKENIGFNRVCYCADAAPTILDLANVAPLDEQRLDGMSLVSGFRTGGESMPHRKLIITLHRGEFPEKKKGAVVMHDQWRLLNGERLYDLESDPLQEHPREVDKAGVKNVLAMFYKQWYEEVEPFYQPGQDCAIPLISPDGKPVELNCFDWRGSDKPPLTQVDIFQRKNANGYWLVDVPQDGTYEFRLALRPFSKPQPIPQGLARIQIGTESGNAPLDGKKTSGVISLPLKKGQYKLQSWILDGQTRSSTGAYYVQVIKSS